MQVKAKGILRHRFWGEYSAAIALEFASEEDARAALVVLKDWAPGAKSPNVLVWTGNSEALDVCKETLTKYGADPSKIDSCAKSIDYGEWFEVTIPVKDESASLENKDQLGLF